MKDREKAQEQGHRIWSIVALFYKALVNFRRQYNRYEEMVLSYSRQLGLSRDLLRLNTAELAGLLDFKSLEDLRDGYIHELKDLCHLVFRSRDQTDPLDRYVSDIFHEISILKEEHYTVKTYAPLYEQDESQYELQYILNEAHELFPQKLHYIHYLFGKATKCMEQHLPSFASMPIVIRSLYVHRERFVKEAYPDGLRHFYRLMYPWGPFEGFFQVGLSFYHSGFLPQALETFREARAEHERLLSGTAGYDGYLESARAAAAAGGGEGADETGAVAAKGEDRTSGPFERSLSRLHSMRRSLAAKLRRTEESLATGCLERPAGAPLRPAATPAALPPAASRAALGSGQHPAGTG